jgi:hypothetical protein
LNSNKIKKIKECFFFLGEKEVTREDFLFSLLICKEERIREPKGMLPNSRWVAAHFAKLYARKLAHLNTFKAFQL